MFIGKGLESGIVKNLYTLQNSCNSISLIDSCLCFWHKA